MTSVDAHVDWFAKVVTRELKFISKLRRDGVIGPDEAEDQKSRLDDFVYFITR